MPNNRIFYPTEKAGIAPNGSTSYTTLRGVQSIGGSLNFELEELFEIGQLETYETEEGIPAVELTMEKVLDGHPPIYTLATQDATSATLIGRSDTQCAIAISIYNDTDDSATGTPQQEVQSSGLYVSNISYSVSNEGSATESITLIGSDRRWVGQVSGTSFATFLDDPFLGNSDEPLAISGSGGVNRRENVLFTYAAGSGALDVNGVSSGIGTILPLDIPGVSTSGTRDKDSSGNTDVHLSSFSSSVDFNREDLFELGTRSEYSKSTTFPLSVTTEITVTAVSGDFVSATESGILTQPVGNECFIAQNLTNRSIRLHMCEGLQLDLGQKNKLSGVSFTGASTDGANLEVTYTYTNNNHFAVYHPQDPNSGSANFNPTTPAKF